MTLEFDLHLRQPKEMFVFDPNTFDPFDDNSLGEPGLDYLRDRVIGFWFRAPKVRTRVFLPPPAVHPDTEKRMRHAMESWCQDLLIANARERVEFLVNNSIFVGIAILVLIFSTWAQGQIYDPARVSDQLLQSTLAYGLDVLVWVALWTPISAFLIEWFPLYRRYQAYKALQHMTLTIHPEEPSEK